MSLTSGDCLILPSCKVAHDRHPQPCLAFQILLTGYVIINHEKNDSSTVFISCIPDNEHCYTGQLLYRPGVHPGINLPVFDIPFKWCCISGGLSFPSAPTSESKRRVTK